MNFAHNDLLIDHIQFNNQLEYLIDLNLLSTRPKNALKRALLHTGQWEKGPNRIESIKVIKRLELRDISKLRISDVSDLLNVGESTLMQLLQELQNALSEKKIEDVPLMTVEIDSIEYMREKIANCRNLEDLIEAMLDYQKSIGIVSVREEEIWRNRLPWLTDNPRTLHAIGNELGLTRERIRQIQKKSQRYPYDINSKVYVLTEVQNILLECTNYEEFRQSMLEEELTSDESITLGRIRHLAVELNQAEAISDVERAIYSWSKG